MNTTSAIKLWCFSDAADKTPVKCYIVSLTGVGNTQRITVSLTNVLDSSGSNLGSVAVQMGVLLGDTTGNGTVTGSDVGQTKLQSGQPLSGSNFRSDVNVSGSINGTDVTTVKLRSGTALPP